MSEREYPDMDTAYEAGVEDGTAFANLHAKVYHDCEHRDAAPSPALTRADVDGLRLEASDGPVFCGVEAGVGSVCVMVAGHQNFDRVHRFGPAAALPLDYPRRADVDGLVALREAFEEYNGYVGRLRVGGREARNRMRALLSAGDKAEAPHVPAFNQKPPYRAEAPE